ncbi:MAG: ABC transporter ATP-binding protein, partial [Candidatus Dormibacteraeota bacterium]|nr:ABC transporter ATP-binding protein [Candidatus Dormibacteraeota bacterium]
GISVLVSSHLLSEVERVCDHVVVIDGGRLLRSSAISTFTRQSPVLAVEVLEEPDELAHRLQGLGMAVIRDHRLLLVELRGDGDHDLIRDAAAELGLGLVRLEQRRHRIEDVFRDSEPGPETAEGVSVVPS